MTKQILIVGGPGNGFDFHGPFDTPEDAIAFAEEKGFQENWWVKDLLPSGEPTMADTIAQLIEEYGKGDVWGEHPDYPREDWGNEAADNDTSLGYWEWVAHKVEADGNGFDGEEETEGEDA